MNRRDIRIIGVVGVGRCGTSMVCQMLEQAMFPMTGDYPTFEADQTMGKHDLWLERIPNHVVKWISPTLNSMPAMPPGFDYKIIFIKRKDHRAQAESQIKLIEWGMGKTNRSPFATFNLRKRIEEEEKIIRKHIIEVAGKNNILPLIFEDVLKDPDLAARRMCAFLLIQHDYAPIMARAVRPRSPECYDGMLDVELIADRMKLEKNGSSF